MQDKLDSLEKLTNAFTLLSGVGRKTAERYALNIINMSDENAEYFSSSIIDAKANIKFCKICGSFSEGDTCNICKNRNSKIICVVKDAKDVLVFEKCKVVNCKYHVLGGTISPLENKGPNDLRIKELVNRINLEEVEEIIIATNPDVEGEVTASYIAKLLKPLNIKVSRLATGIQMGSDLQYTDEVTLNKAITDRKIL